MNAPEPLMQQKYSEEWVVLIDKEAFTLSKKQLELLKEATKQNQRGLIWFGDFAISIPHIKAIYLKSRRLDDLNQIEAPKPREWTEEDEENAKKKLAEMKDKFHFK